MKDNFSLEQGQMNQFRMFQCRMQQNAHSLVYGIDTFQPPTHMQPTQYRVQKNPLIEAVRMVPYSTTNSTMTQSPSECKHLPLFWWHKTRWGDTLWKIGDTLKWLGAKRSVWSTNYWNMV